MPRALRHLSTNILPKSPLKGKKWTMEKCKNYLNILKTPAEFRNVASASEFDSPMYPETTIDDAFLNEDYIQDTFVDAFIVIFV